jgi:hypothetical protein
LDSTTSNGGAGDRRSDSRALGAPAPSAEGRFAFFVPARADVEADRALEVGIRLPTAGCPGSAGLPCLPRVRVRHAIVQGFVQRSRLYLRSPL